MNDCEMALVKINVRKCVGTVERGGLERVVDAIEVEVGFVCIVLTVKAGRVIVGKLFMLSWSI